MPSFHPSNPLAATLGCLRRVWAGRIFKPSPGQRRQIQTSSPSANSTNVNRLGQSSVSPRHLPSDSGAPERQTIWENNFAIKKDEYDDVRGAVYHDQKYDQGEVYVDSEAVGVGMDEESCMDIPLIPQDNVISLASLCDRDKPVHSIEVYDEDMITDDSSPSFRGGSRLDDGGDQCDNNRSGDGSTYECQIDMDDYYESEEDFAKEYDIDSADLASYRIKRTCVKNIAGWVREAANAHKLITLCGKYPLMPSSWEWDLIDHPSLDGLFVPSHSDKKSLFNARSSQFRATRALRDLFESHIRICAYRQDGLHDKIADVIEKEIRKYSSSVEKDMKLRGHQNYVSPIFIVKFKKLSKVPPVKGGQDGLGKWVHEEAMQACRARVEQYHAEWAELGVDSYPRVMYAFVIIQQTVQIWAIDSDIPVGELQEPLPLKSIDLSIRNDWLGCSLAIATPIHLAKESMCAHRWAFPNAAKDDDDPDI